MIFSFKPTPSFNELMAQLVMYYNVYMVVDYSIIIPAYNEAKWLPKTLETIHQAMATIPQNWRNNEEQKLSTSQSTRTSNVS